MVLPTGYTLRPLHMAHSEAFLTIIDQTLLPQELVWLELGTIEAVWEAIHHLRVRGAPAIGVAAAYGLYQATRETVQGTVCAAGETDHSALLAAFSEAKAYLA